MESLNMKNVKKNKQFSICGLQTQFQHYFWQLGWVWQIWLLLHPAPSKGQCIEMIVFPYFINLIYCVMANKNCVYVCARAFKHVLWAGPGRNDLLYRLKGLVLSWGHTSNMAVRHSVLFSFGPDGDWEACQNSKNRLQFAHIQVHS